MPEALNRHLRRFGEFKALLIVLFPLIGTAFTTAASIALGTLSLSLPLADPLSGLRSPAETGGFAEIAQLEEPPAPPPVALPPAALSPAPPAPVIAEASPPAAQEPAEIASLESLVAELTVPADMQPLPAADPAETAPLAAQPSTPQLAIAVAEALQGPEEVPLLQRRAEIPAEIQAETDTSPELASTEIATPEPETAKTETPEIETAAIETPGVETAASETPGVADQKVRVRRGDTLMSLLTRAGIARQEAHSAIAALRDVFRPQDLKPGQDLHLALAREDSASRRAGLQLVSLNLRPDLERDIRVTRDGSGPGFVAKAVARPLTRELVSDSAVVETSLSQAGQAAGIPGAVMLEAIRLFSYNVDFQREIRRADDLEVLYESHVDETGRRVKTGALVYAALTVSGKTHRLYRFERQDRRPDYFDEEGHSIRKSLLRTPIDGARLSSGYGMRRHPILGYNKMHRGLDFAAPTGTPIYAAGDGKIERIGRNGGYGKYIRIRHNGKFKTAYAHLSKYAKGLKKGARVEQGQIIGYVGSTGRSTGPHLHYEVLYRGKQTDPRKLDLPRGLQLEGQELKTFKAERDRIDRLRRRPVTEQLVASSGCEEVDPMPLAQGDSEPATC